MKMSCCWLREQHQPHDSMLKIFLCPLREGDVLKIIQGYSAKFVYALLCPSISHLKALFCLCQQLLQSFYYNRDKVGSVLITDTTAWLSVYSSYLPLPLNVVWVMLSSYYHRAFGDASRKSQAASL
jgi:hypothetical protein